MAPTHRGCALVSVTDHHHRQLLSADHLHHGLLGQGGEGVNVASWTDSRVPEINGTVKVACVSTPE